MEIYLHFFLLGGRLDFLVFYKLSTVSCKTVCLFLKKVDSISTLNFRYGFFGRIPQQHVTD